MISGRVCLGGTSQKALYMNNEITSRVLYSKRKFPALNILWVVLHLRYLYLHPDHFLNRHQRLKIYRLYRIEFASDIWAFIFHLNFMKYFCVARLFYHSKTFPDMDYPMSCRIFSHFLLYLRQFGKWSAVYWSCWCGSTATRGPGWSMKSDEYNCL